MLSGANMVGGRKLLRSCKMQLFPVEAKKVEGRQRNSRLVREEAVSAIDATLMKNGQTTCPGVPEDA